MRIDRPAEDDHTQPGKPESRTTDSPPTSGHQALDRVAHVVGYQATVDAAYHEYRAETAVTARQKTYDAGLDSRHGQDRRGLISTGSAEREARHVCYRALVETEYRDTHSSQDAALPASPQFSADSDLRLLHADADPLRALGPASETHPDEL
ncbi:MAG TPA: hypothetical protein VGD91_12950, partial [Trebonia sp.]